MRLANPAISSVSLHFVGVDHGLVVFDVQGRRKLCLEWTEHAGPPVHPPQHEGFGSILLNKVLPIQVKAEVEVQFAPDGLRCRIGAPLIEQRLVPEY